MCQGSLAEVRTGFVIVGDTSSGGCTDTMAGTWSVRTPNPTGHTTICRVNLGEIPAGYHQIGGSTTGGPCTSLPGYWIIAPD